MNIEAKDKKKAIIVVVIVALALALVGLTSYVAVKYLSKDKADTSTINDPVSNAPEIGDPKTTHSSEMPAGLPTDTPLFDGAKLLDATTAAMGEQMTEYILNFSATNSPAEVFAFYKNALNSNGWKTHVTQSNDSLNLVAASHREKNLRANFSSLINDPGRAGTDFSLSISVMALPAPMP